MRVLAIDPGYGRCGVAVVEKASPEKLLYSACIETPAKAPFTERLNTIARECERLLREYAPDALALEKLFFNSNQKTAMHVAEVRGALMQAATDFGVPIFQYAPGEVKVAAAGSGGADKKAMIKMIRALVRIEKDIRHDDEYDAIAIGITHLAHTRNTS